MLPLLGSCFVPDKEQKVPLERIDLSDYSELSFAEYLSDHLNDVSVLKVDESPEFRLGTVDRAQFTESAILLRDIRMHHLVAISRDDGHGLSVIGSRGRAENEFIQVSGFDCDRNNDVLVLDARSRKINRYDGQDYHFVEKVSVQDSPIDIKCLENGDYALYLYPMKRRNASQLRVVSSEMSDSQDILPIARKVDLSCILTTQSFNTSSPTRFYSSDIFVDDIITELDEHGRIVQQYELNFGDYRIPDGIRATLSARPKELMRYRCACAPFFAAGDKIGGKLFNKTKLSFFIADKNTKTIYIPDEDLEQMVLIHCDNQTMSFYINSEVSNSLISSLCPYLDRADYILTLNTTN